MKSPLCFLCTDQNPHPQTSIIHDKRKGWFNALCKWFAKSRKLSYFSHWGRLVLLTSKNGLSFQWGSFPQQYLAPLISVTTINAQAPFCVELLSNQMNHQTDLCLTYLSNRAKVFTRAEAPSKPLWARGRTVVRAAWLWEMASSVSSENSLYWQKLNQLYPQAFEGQGYGPTLSI